MTIVEISAAKMNKVCKASVYTIVRIPPLNVYIHISSIVISIVILNGIFRESKNAICKTHPTRNNRNEAPIV